MKLWTRVRLWVTDLFQRARFEDGLAEELAFHILARTEHWERQGLAPVEARRRARLEFGSVDKAKAEVREVRLGAWVDEAARNLLYGLRMLRKYPGFTAMAVLSLAIGIGANTAIFSLVNAVLLRKTPLERPGELVNIYQSSPAFTYGMMSYPDVEELRDGTPEVFGGIAAMNIAGAQVDDEDRAGVLFVEAVTGEFFSVLGIEAQLGRTIGPEDDEAAGAHPVVTLGHGYWQRRFGGDPDAVGRTLRVGGRDYTIVGVAPADYRGSYPGIVPAFYAPMSMLDQLIGANARDDRGFNSTTVKARLAPGVTRAQAESAAAAVARSLDRTRPPGWNPGNRFTVVPTTDVLFSPDFDTYIRATAWLLLVVVGLVLLLACTNLASFLLARALAGGGRWPCGSPWAPLEARSYGSS